MFNNEILNNFTIQAAAIIPIITAIVQAFKLTQWVKDKYAPFLSMAIGIGVTFLLASDAMGDISGTILSGILFGLAASGLYSGLTHTAAVIKQDRIKAEQKKQQKHIVQANKDKC